MLLSGSRDKSLIIWNLTRDEQHYGYPKRSLHGHSHIVSDCVSLKLPGLENARIRVDREIDRSFHLTEPTPFPHPGIKLYVSGNWQRASQLAVLSATTTMSSRYPSLPITDRSYLDRETERSSYGTPSGTANSPLPKRGTPSGYHVCDSAQTLKIQSLSAQGGIN